MAVTEPESIQLKPTVNRSETASGLDGSSNDDYDPHLHRQLPKPTNNFETLIHLLKSSLGTGILAMPQAFANAGLITGVVSTILTGVLVTHCLHVLVNSQYETCKRRRVPLLAYRDAMAEAVASGPERLRPMARSSAIIVDIFLVIYQLGICCVYIVFIAENLKKIVDEYHEMELGIHMLILLLPLVAFNLIPNLKVLAPFSAVANLLIFIGLGIIVYYLLTMGNSDEPLDLWGSPAKFPLFFGSILFALTAVGVVVALENNMKTPKAFGTPCGVLNTGMSLIVLMYVVIGVLGYVNCVSKCPDSITLNLPRGGLAVSVMVMFMVAIFISYGLQCYVPVEVVWKGYVLPRLVASSATPRKVLIAEYGLRVVLCLLTFIVAAVIPRLGLFISLFGALCLSALGICFPAIMDICLKFPDKLGPRRIKLIKNIILIIIGLIGMIAGTYAAVADIVKSFTKKDG